MRRLLAVALLLMLPACGSAPVQSADLSVYEFGIESNSTRFFPGGVDLAVSNEGEYPHTLVISDAAGHVLFASDVLAPGATMPVGVDLAPGKYTFTCRIVGQDDQGHVVDHYERGMSLDVEVGGA